jgi:hypothetical protein
MLREIRLSSQGIQVGEPLTNFHGVLTGVPNLTEPLKQSAGWNGPEVS